MVGGSMRLNESTYDNSLRLERPAMNENLGYEKKSIRLHGWLGLSIIRALRLQSVEPMHIAETLPNCRQAQTEATQLA